MENYLLIDIHKKRIKALVVVHVYGFSCQISKTEKFVKNIT